MKYVFKTDIGLVRDENQDRIRIHQLSDRYILAVVCDGMGGQSSGSEASEIAINILCDKIISNFKEEFDSNSIRNLILSSISAANIHVYSESVKNKDKEGMGTTCVVIIMDDKYVHIANVGDSRGYLIFNGELKQLTKDHTIVRMLLEQGKIKESEVKDHPQRNLITKAIGVENEISPDYFEYIIENNSIILLCSDGLSSYCEEKILLNIINSFELERASDELVKYALKQGGIDNISLGLIAN